MVVAEGTPWTVFLAEATNILKPRFGCVRKVFVLHPEERKAKKVGRPSTLDPPEASRFATALAAREGGQGGALPCISGTRMTMESLVSTYMINERHVLYVIGEECGQHSWRS